MSDVLHRAFALELRAAGDGRTVVGTAVPFDTPTDVGGYVESFARGAFARTIAERGPARVKVLAQHDGRANPIGRAELLREDPAGLHCELRISKTQAGDEALELIRDGALDGLSIGFSPVRDAMVGDVLSRTEVRLHEISVVSWPAYDGARVAQVRTAPLGALASNDLARRRLALTLAFAYGAHR